MYKHIPLLPNSMITMNTLKLFLCVCLMPGFSLYAQVRIHGKVTDLDNQPLAYSTSPVIKNRLSLHLGYNNRHIRILPVHKCTAGQVFVSIQYNRIQTANNTGKCFKPRYTTTCNYLGK